ncbi:MAG: hypothetical protein ACRYHQ_26465, partial [Janthinobacterium lividum]
MSHSVAAPGDRAPFCFGVTSDGAFYSSERQVGRVAVLVLGGSLPPDALLPMLAACLRQEGSLAAAGADLLLVGSGTMLRRIRDTLPDLGGMVTVDCDPGFLRQCGAGTERPLVLVLDRAWRVAARLDEADAEATVAAALACVRALPAEPEREVALPAPVLMLPGLLDRALCRELIERFEREETFDSGFSSMDAAGNPVSKVDHAKKKRRDYLVEPDSALHLQVLDLLNRRCLPELRKAFQFEALHTDRILVARYDDSGGHFRRHRDNTGK